MAEKKKREEPRWMVLDPLFRKPADRYRRKDTGSVAIVEHRVGRMAGCFKKEEAFKRAGLEKEWTRSLRHLDKLRDRDEADRMAVEMYHSRMDDLSKMIRQYRGWLKRFYAGQGLVPRFSYVPINDLKETALYVQAMVDVKTKKLAVGDPKDLLLWTETTFVRTLAIANLNEEAQEQAKALMKTAGVDKEIAYRCQQLLKGQVEFGGFLTAGKEE